MNTPLFSQIPAVVLEKFAPIAKTKRVKFCEDIPEEVETGCTGPEDVSSSSSIVETIVIDDYPTEEDRETPSQNGFEIKKPESQISFVERGNINDNEGLHLAPSTKRQTQDAIVQVETPKLVSRETQTDIQMNDFYFMNEHQNSLQNQCLGYKPMYSIPKKDGEQPPLKLGLSLRGGRKKRKVFYPDDDED